MGSRDVSWSRRGGTEAPLCSIWGQTLFQSQRVAVVGCKNVSFVCKVCFRCHSYIVIQKCIMKGINLWILIRLRAMWRHWIAESSWWRRNWTGLRRDWVPHFKNWKKQKRLRMKARGQRKAYANLNFINIDTSLVPEPLFSHSTMPKISATWCNSRNLRLWG